MTQLDLNSIWPFELCRGNSKAPPEGACLLDAVSWFEYGKLGDHPVCVSRFLAGIGRLANDSMDGTRRQKLRRFIPRLPGTVDGRADRARTNYAQFVTKELLGKYPLRSHPGAIHLKYAIQAEARVEEVLNEAICFARNTGFARRKEEELRYIQLSPYCYKDDVMLATSARIFMYDEVMDLLEQILDVGCAIPPRATDAGLDLQAIDRFQLAGGKKILVPA